MKFKVVGTWIFLVSILALPLAVFAQDAEMLAAASSTVEVTSGGQTYPAYLAAPTEGGPYPGIVFIHSFRGLEEGYKTMVDQFAAEGFVVLAIEWQTFAQDPGDVTMQTLVEDSIAFLSERENVDAQRIGLTGFCAGGRYTMLLTPQIDSIKAGVAWYGFPNNGDPAPVDLVGELDAPLLIIHGTADEPSPIGTIYDYVNVLTSAGKYFELKVYAGEPHGFILSGGQLRDDEVAVDAYNEMVDFFKRKLVAAS
ncbi:MAG TPA: dienelactone hydrolase family protein [Phototrophicaceae bacterium]|nr:dienelactone hydrolase family protein [Phototrophicaceae bacterium]